MSAEQAAKLQDIQENPERHHHDFWQLQQCCVIGNSIDAMLVEAHPALGRNGGRKCDVTSGPCSCGGWH